MRLSHVKLPQWKWGGQGKPQLKNHHFIPVVAAIIALFYGIARGAWLLLCFVGFVGIIATIVLYAAQKARRSPNPDKEKKEKKPTGKAPTRRWRRWIGRIFVLAVIIFVVLIFSPTIRKDLIQGSPVPTPRHYNYRPTFVCEDAWEQEQDLNYENFTGRYFDVTLREGCWGGKVTLPKAWASGWNSQVLGNDPETWIAIWFPGYPPAGPFGRNAVTEFPCHPGEFRLQGRGTFRFYHR